MSEEYMSEELEHIHVVVHYPCGCITLRPIRTMDWQQLAKRNEQGEIEESGLCKRHEERRQSKLAARYGGGFA